MFIKQQDVIKDDFVIVFIDDEMIIKEYYPEYNFIDVVRSLEIIGKYVKKISYALRDL